MPKRKDIKSILIIGSGPIVIGQACEFDYSGTQACKALKSEGYRIILLNSNPATIMTDPEFSDATYIEPINLYTLEKIIIKEKPDAVLPTLGGQTALNIAYQAMSEGIFKKYGVETLGVSFEALNKAEDRKEFAHAMKNIGLKMADAVYVSDFNEALQFLEEQSFPLVVRPYYTLGGSGGSVIHQFDEFKEKIEQGIRESPVGKILLEKSLMGWKEFELEVMRDNKDNVVIICSIENIDPVGVHTGDSITVAPAQTLTDKQYQQMRDASIAVIREIGVETGGSNIQFAVNPDNGDMLVIEMNPRVSRSSALASKATGFPIAKIATYLAIGYTLNEIQNDITKKTPASFEPTVDYCVVKIPRFTFEKFQDSDPALTTAMHSVGEVMAIGRTFKGALQKGLRSLETKCYGLRNQKIEKAKMSSEKITEKLKTPNPERVFYIKEAFKKNFSIRQIYEFSKIDPWFLCNIKDIIDFESGLIKLAEKSNFFEIPLDTLREAKRLGFSDKNLSEYFETDEFKFRHFRISKDIKPVYKLVDTCAAEFESYTPYFYSTYETENEIRYQKRKKIIILGSGPNRIGQGIEFDYCCVHASMTLREMGYDSIMINSNPETVSTDYDTSTKLFFEPLTFEDVKNIIDEEKPEGVIIQFGGQSPLNLALDLFNSSVPILGTSPLSVNRVEDRNEFCKLIAKLNLRQPESGSVKTVSEAIKCAERIQYPLMVRPSYVLGGRAMKIVYNQNELLKFLDEAIELDPNHPVLVDKYLSGAVEIDVDAIGDGTQCIIAGIMEHIEYAGVHSGDSACAIPYFSLSDKIIFSIKKWTAKIAKELNVIGLMNIQYAVYKDNLYILEVNLRASRTIPYVSKATGVAWAKIATRVMCGKTLKQLDVKEVDYFNHYSIKEAVLPFNRFSKVDIILGPEMRSTGEVMGIDSTFEKAFIKSQASVYQHIPKKGNFFISVSDDDKNELPAIARKVNDLGYKIYATEGTARIIHAHNIKAVKLNKIKDGSLNALDLLNENKIHIVINTPSNDKSAMIDEKKIRNKAVKNGVPIVTRIESAQCFLNGLSSYINEGLEVKSLQDWYRNSRDYNEPRN